MSDKFEKIGNITLDYTYYPGKDLYVDGSEDELLEIVSTYDKNEYNRIISEKKTWHVLYHLSHIRENVVSWLPISENDSVLEIGAGCGAITGALAKNAKEVDCIELSKKRSLVNATRNKEHDNVNILVGNFQDIEPTLTKKYDYITLIGVLEYAASYINAENPYEEFLNIIKKHLKPDGRIVIAIENRYGLKYFAGCREDHIGALFAGIEGYVGIDGVKTFGKNELTHILKNCGLSNSTFYYPYPDYKLPHEIYSDKLLPKTGSLNNNLRNFDSDRLLLFDEKRVYDSLIKDGLFDIFSNSFVVCAGMSEKEVDHEIEYVKYSNDRGAEFSIFTELGMKNDGSRYVIKKQANKQSAAHIKNIADDYNALCELFKDTDIKPNKCTLTEAGAELEYLEGNTLTSLLDEYLDKGKLSKFTDTVKKYCDSIRGCCNREYEYSDDFEKMFGITKDQAAVFDGKKSFDISNLDMIFDNIIIGEEGNWNLVDYEWTFKVVVPVDYILFRTAHYFESPKRNKCMKDLDIYELLGIDKNYMELFNMMEQGFQQYVTTGNKPLRLLYGDIGKPMFSGKKEIDEYRGKVAQIVYYFNDNSYDDSLYMNYHVDSSGICHINIPVRDDLRFIRFDPASLPCIVNIISIKGIAEQPYDVNYGHNGASCDNRFIAFETTDPQIIIGDLREEVTSFEVTLKIEFPSAEAIAMTAQMIADTNKTLADERAASHALRMENAEMKDSLGWRITKSIRSLKDGKK